MKKKLLFTLLYFSILSFGFAKGNYWDASSDTTDLPKKGSFYAGFSINPYFDYFGKAARSDSGAYSSYFHLKNNFQFGYYLKDRKVLNFSFAFATQSTTRQNQVNSDLSTHVPPAIVFDQEAHKANAFSIGCGVNYRSKIRRRFIPYIGWNVGANFRKEKYVYSYGNAITASDLSPTSTTDFSTGATANVTSRLAENNMGAVFGFSLNAVAGFDFFLSKSIMFKAEYVAGYSGLFAGSNEMKYDSWAAASTQIESSSTFTGKTTSNRFGTGDPFINQIFPVRLDLLIMF